MKKIVRLADRKECAQHLVEQHQISERKACSMIKLTRMVYLYENKTREDTQLIEKLQRLASERPGYGFWKMNDRLHLEGYRWNHKKIYRVYTELKLNIRRRHKRRLPARTKTPLQFLYNLVTPGAWIT